MKHAGQVALDRLEPLLAQIRALPNFVERRRGVFYVKSRAALHFHEHGTSLFADLRLSGASDFERLNIDKPEGQRTLLKRIHSQA